MATPPPSSPSSALRDVSNHYLNTPARAHTPPPQTQPSHAHLLTPTSSPFRATRPPKRWLASSPPLGDDDDTDPFVDMPECKRSKAMPASLHTPVPLRLLNREIGALYAARQYYPKVVFHCQDSLRLHDEHGHGVVPFSCNYSRDGRVLAVAAEDGHVRLYKADKSFYSFKAHENSIFHVTWAQGDKALVTCSGDQSARVWNVDKQRCIAQLRGHTATVKCAAVHSEQPAVLATCSRDGRTMIWDLRCSFSSIGQLDEAPIHRPTKVIQAAHPRIQPAVSTNKKRMHQHASSAHHHHHPPPPPPPLAQMNQSVTSVVFMKSHAHHLITSGSVDDVIKCWDWRSLGFTSKSGPRPVAQSTSVNKACGISWLTQDVDGCFVYAVSTANRIHQYHPLYLGRPLRTFTADNYAVNSFYVRASVHPEGHCIASGSSNGHIYLWNTMDKTEHAKPANVLQAHTVNEMPDVTWKDAHALASISDDAFVHVWTA